MIIQMYRDDNRKSITYIADLRAELEIVDEMNGVTTQDMIYDSLYRLLEDSFNKEKYNREYKREYKFVMAGH